MISLVTIVKNEARNLPAMVTSAIPVVDEFIIVDTGSTDDTVRVAEKLGSFVKVFQWGHSDNFSQPRNYGLLQATGDWVLHIDADDRLTQIGCDTIAALCEQPVPEGITGYAFQIKENCERPYIAPSSGRLFPNHMNLTYKGHVHMEIQGGRWALCTDGPHIEHNGYMTPDQRRAKLERNIRLLMLDIEDDDDDANAMYYLATHFKDLGRDVDADYWARRALAYNNPPWVANTLQSCLQGQTLKVEWFDGRIAS